MAEEWPEIGPTIAAGLTVGQDHRARSGIVAGRRSNLPRGRSAGLLRSLRVRRMDVFRSCANTGPPLRLSLGNLPAGLVEPDEDPAEGCRRELLEETGYSARAIHALGSAAPCTGG